MRINDIDIRQHGFYLLQKERSEDMFPAVSHNIVEIPGILGKRKGRTEIEEKVRTETISVKGCDTPEELEYKIKKLKSFFTNEYGELITVKIQPINNGRYYYADIEGATPIERINSVGKIQISLVSYEPYEYDPDVSITVNSFPTSIYGPESMSSTNGVFSFTFTAATSDFRVTDLKTGKYVRLLHSFAIGDTLKINMKTELCEKNNLRIMPDLALESKFFPIRAGENEINCDGEGTLAIEYTPKYL